MAPLVFSAGRGDFSGGYLRYSCRRLTRLTEGFLIGGGAIFIVALALSYRELIGFSANDRRSSAPTR